MGLFWDLIQQSELDEQKGKADSLEERVATLENELSSTNHYS
jgi:polyhydroxyalkanoate synthesis regulator phasin